jgi:hypothetical protein
MTTSYVIYLLVGRLLIFLGMKFPPLSESRLEFIKRQWTCGLCSGVIVYTILAFAMGEVLLKDIFYVPVLSELITGGISSFIMHLLVTGWKENFEVVVIN